MLGFAKACLLTSLTREPDLACALTIGTRARSTLLLLRWRRGDYTTDYACASQPGRSYVGVVCIYPYCTCDATSYATSGVWVSQVQLLSVSRMWRSIFKIWIFKHR